MRILQHPLLKVSGYPFLSESPLIILFTLDVYASRKKHPFLYSEFTKQSIVKSTLDDIFRKTFQIG